MNIQDTIKDMVFLLETCTLKMCSAYYVWKWALLFISEMLLWILPDSQPQLISLDQEKLKRTLLVIITINIVVSAPSKKFYFTGEQKLRCN